MKQTLLILLSAACLVACKKKDNVINNYYPGGGSQPSFIINGISDVSFVNDMSYGSALGLMAGGTTYNGAGSVSANHSINISIFSSCALNMF